MSAGAGCARLVELVGRGGPVLADGGIETWLVHAAGVELPDLGTVGLLDDPDGVRVLEALYGGYLDVASAAGLPVVVGTPTWRGGPDRIAAAGLPDGDVERLAAAGVGLVRSLVANRPGGAGAWVAAVLGPRHDGYNPAGAPGVADAARYHRRHAAALAAAGPDLLFGVPLPSADEAVGMGQAMAATGTGWVPSFLVGPSGALPDGTPLAVAIERVCTEVSAPPLWVSVSCVHPDVLVAAHAAGAHSPAAAAQWRRVRQFKANGSDLPPAELDDLDHVVCDDPAVWADAMVRARNALGLAVVGGCCGTDPAHLGALAARLS